MKKVLITGGPVPGKLDDVKIVTNKFKGGLMAKLADQLYDKGDVHITYLTYKGSKLPERHELGGWAGMDVVFHDGFADYALKVSELAPQMDCVILGAAVANLIPVKPFPGKFPSHNYKPGDIIPIDFTIAPRVIDMVKSVNPKAILFGFKLLSNVDHNELIRAAYEVCLSSKATAIFANDASDLSVKYAVTKEHSVIPLELDSYVNFIYEHMHDKYFHTELIPASFDNQLSIAEYEASVRAHRKFWQLVEEYQGRFTKVEDFTFGTIAVRSYENQFVTSVRGKNEFEDAVLVRGVDPTNGNVIVYGSKKPTLNAPLIGGLFETNPECAYIVHLHDEQAGLPLVEYAVPGTMQEASVSNVKTSFNIEHHGCILMFNAEGRRL